MERRREGYGQTAFSRQDPKLIINRQWMDACGNAFHGYKYVTEQLLAALTAAGRWKPSEIHVVSVTSRA